MNFTLQDFIGATIAFCLFPLVIVIPGYVVGWVFDLFDFRHRQLMTRLGIGLLLSFSVSPIVLQLTSSLLSYDFALLTLTGFAIVFIIILFREKYFFTPESKHQAKFLFGIGIGWTVFAILSLINVQWGDKLFYSVTSFDQTTRVSVIEAMTRTGVPPINPSYYPGHPVPLTFLYYFWYILCSMIDAAGGRYVDARAALNASSAWAGLGLMAVIPLYLYQRNPNRAETSWRSVKIGIALLAVSGLDVIPITMLMLATGKIVGSIDVWNTWIQSWIASALWVPHHIAALIVGLTIMMLAQSARGKTVSTQFVILTIVGLGFASALGLSIYVTIVFAVFWGIWFIMMLFQNSDRSLILPIITSGLVALVLVSPFLMGLFQAGGGSETRQLPVMFEIRTFLQLESFVQEWSLLARSLIMLAALPVNYLFELGFFFMAGLLWFKINSKRDIFANPFYLAEVLLLAVSFFIGSCLRSTLITSNDLGWRAWLPGQFILLIWGVDVLEKYLPIADYKSRITVEAQKNKTILLVFLSVGILTSLVDTGLLRFAWPIMTGPKETLKYYSARLAFDYLSDNVPEDAITQINPSNFIDRPSGLYGTHQMIVSDRTAYGVPLSNFNILVDNVGQLFTGQDIAGWSNIDILCQKYSIDVLIFEDTDPIWNSLSELKKLRSALYENSYYAIFSCGAGL